MDAQGLHTMKTGQITRQRDLHDIIWRAFGAAGISAVEEPSGLDRQDGKRPDGLTLIPWHGGRSLVWDVTVVSPLAASYVDRLVAWLSGRTSVSGRRTFPVLRSTCS